MATRLSFPGGNSSIRELDLRYTSRPAASSYRPYFDFVANHARAYLDSNDNASILDIGCANGAFLHYMLTRFPKARCTGIDAIPELVSISAANVSGATFATGDIQRAETLPAEKYSLVTLLTLHSHFDELGCWLDNTLNLVQPGGKAFLFGPFNPKPVDVLVRLRVGDEEGGSWIPGWNVHSRLSFEKYLAQRGLAFTFHDYTPPGLILPDEKDPLRTYSAMLDDAAILTNGAGLLLTFALLEISL